VLLRLLRLLRTFLRVTETLLNSRVVCERLIEVLAVGRIQYRVPSGSCTREDFKSTFRLQLRAGPSCVVHRLESESHVC